MKNEADKFIIIISGPSGVGKGSIIKEILKARSDIKLAISATTRHPRRHEKEGTDYYFLSEAEFNKKIKNNEFLEYALVHHNKYGTYKKEVDNYLSEGYYVILEIDIQGADKVKKHYDNIISIFISPPSFNDLIERLHTRNTEEKTIIAARLANAGKELTAIGKYDYIVINNNIETAKTEVLNIIDNISSVFIKK